VGETAQIGAALGEAARVVFGVALADAEQDQRPGADLAHHLAFHRDARAAYPLDVGPHPLVGGGCFDSRLGSRICTWRSTRETPLTRRTAPMTSVSKRRFATSIRNARRARRPSPAMPAERMLTRVAAMALAMSASKDGRSVP